MADSIITGIKDLLKFNIISNVNTGDKTQDNLLNAVILSFLSAIFTPGLQYQVQMLFSKLTSKCIKQKITQTNYDVIRKYMEINKIHFMQTNWTVKSCISTDELTNALCQFIIKNYNWAFKRGSLFHVDQNGEKKIKKSVNEHEFFMLKRLFESEVIYPLYLSGKNIVGLIKNAGDDSIYFIHSNDEILKDFIEHIIEIYEPVVVEEKPPNEVIPQCFVYDHSSGERQMIYQDRTFDKIVTKHKPKILNLLNNFKESNTSGKQSSFNGMGTYNLGLLFYGPPGTGKTSFIKTICNYLRRDAVIIDMRAIKTIQELKNVFGNYTIRSTVYVFDEFDCVQELLQRKTKSTKDEARELQAEVNKLLQIKASAILTNNTASIDEQIMQIKKKIANLENQLNLENMLTFLDGTVEMRNRIIIAATNCIDSIDKALIRAGRFDAKICLEEFEDAEIKEQLCLMFPNEDQSKIMNVTFPSRRFVPVQIANIVQETQSLDKTIEILLTPSKEETIIKDNGKRLVRSVSPESVVSSDSNEEGVVILSKNKRRKRCY